MFIKFISSTLVFVLFNQIAGCYLYQDITKEEIVQKADNTDLRIETKNHNTYEFNEEDDIIKEYSIYGSGILLQKDRIYVNEDFTGSLYLDDIKSLKMEKFSLALTIVAIAIPVGLIILGLISVTPMD